MTIHYATAKKAASLEISLVEIDRDGETLAQATGRNPKCIMVARDPKIALAAVLLAKILKAEYPALVLEQEDLRFVVSATDDNEETHTLHDRSALPVLADILEAAEELGIDPEAGYNEERGVVVPERYKALYAERGNRDNCGDWLAQALAGLFTSEARNPDGVASEYFNSDDFTDFLVLNDVDMVGKWANLPTSGQRGWAGRYKMGGNNKLRKIIARRGTLILDAKHTVTPPEEFLEAMLEKHPNVEAEWV